MAQFSCSTTGLRIVVRPAREARHAITGRIIKKDEGQAIHFVRGFYATEDSEEIAILKEKAKYMQGELIEITSADKNLVDILKAVEKGKLSASDAISNIQRPKGVQILAPEAAPAKIQIKGGGNPRQRA